MKIKIYYLLSIFLLVGCGSQDNRDIENDNKITSDNVNRKSIHQEEWEKFQNENPDSELGDKVNISIVHEQVVTKESVGRFINPRYTTNGKYIIFCSDDFNEIWSFDLSTKVLKKIIDLPLCGANFQLSDEQHIFFRNRAVGSKRKGAVYSIFKYSINTDEIDVIYKSNNRLSAPQLINNSLYFLENDIPKNFNLITNQLGSDFDIPFFYVENNVLIKFADEKDTHSFKSGSNKFISCTYSDDDENIFVLTANDGMVVINLDGEIIKSFSEASRITKLSGSNLLIISEQKDDGHKIITSDLVISFLNSDKSIRLKNEQNELRYNPTWSHSSNEIAYSNGKGQIKIISLNVSSD